ncbi:hypothetical protein QYE76_026450 [Lolium multiflorum]|uniref:Remorin C-terminal domain-containing protein n=1 Tax=Lolium multiflorum TaxID=4521 RepID=A0AAD8RFZ5_LOLMU|nr:hypothetical protein QYE76_026450 [Lolium multiflorum]
MEGYCMLYADYFADNPLHGESVFRRRFRMSRKLFLQIVYAIRDFDPYFRCKADCTGLVGFSSLQKCRVAMRMLAYGAPGDGADDYLRMAESTALDCFYRFRRAHSSLSNKHHMREGPLAQPNHQVPTSWTAFIAMRQEIRDSTMHQQLQDDLVEHIWTLRGNANADANYTAQLISRCPSAPARLRVQEKGALLGGKRTLGVLLLIQLRLSQIRQPSKFEERQESVVLLAREKMEMQEPKGAHAVAPPPTAVEAGKPAGVGGVVQNGPPAPAQKAHAPAGDGGVPPAPVPASADNAKAAAGSADRDAVLAKVEMERKLSMVKAWEEHERSKVDNRAEHKMSSILSWENTKKASIEAKLRTREEKLEKKKAEYAEKMRNQMATIHKEAEEKRASVEAKRQEEVLRYQETAAKHRSTGTTPKKKFLQCFG